jgi:hypothetical protein
VSYWGTPIPGPAELAVGRFLVAVMVLAGVATVVVAVVLLLEPMLE